MIVLDASALIALIANEPGGPRVSEAVDEETVIGAVNFTEVVTKFVDSGWTEDAIRRNVQIATIRRVDFDEAMAYDAGLLRAATRHLGLSLGDRACLALAKQLGAPVLTADRAWRDLDVGVAIEVIR